MGVKMRACASMCDSLGTKANRSFVCLHFVLSADSLFTLVPTLPYQHQTLYPRLFVSIGNQGSTDVNVCLYHTGNVGVEFLKRG